MFNLQLFNSNNNNYIKSVCIFIKKKFLLLIFKINIQTIFGKILIS